MHGKVHAWMYQGFTHIIRVHIVSANLFVLLYRLFYLQGVVSTHFIVLSLWRHSRNAFRHRFLKVYLIRKHWCAFDTDRHCTLKFKCFKAYMYLPQHQEKWTQSICEIYVIWRLDLCIEFCKIPMCRCSDTYKRTKIAGNIRRK